MLGEVSCPTAGSCSQKQIPHTQPTGSLFHSWYQIMIDYKFKNKSTLDTHLHVIIHNNQAILKPRDTINI